MNKNFMAELNKLAISDDIKLKAYEFFITNNLSYRKGKKLPHLLFYCIYRAYQINHQYKVPKTIANMVGLNYSDISEAQKMFAKNGGVIENSSYKDYIPIYCDKIGIPPDHACMITNYGIRLVSEDPTLEEKFPQNVAVAIIFYYLDIGGYEAHRKNLSNLVEISDVTIFHIYKQIRNFQNPRK